MRLLAAVLPPQAAREDLADVVASVRGADTQLEVTPSARLYLPLANFEKVVLGGATELRQALSAAAAGWPPMRLRFRGGAALPEPGDDSVWARLEGDLDELSAVGGAIPRVARQVGFLVDRRLFRLEVRVGRITEATTEMYLQRLLDRLEAYTGPDWPVHAVSLLRVVESSDSDAPHEEWHRLPLGAR